MKSIGQYVVEKENIGRRSFRSSMRTSDSTPTPQAPTAIKCISKEDLRSGLSLVKGHNKLSQLSHPNLVQYRDFKETRHNIYLVSEYEEGVSLDRLGR